MTAAVRIEASDWGDFKYATLARIMGFADADHALVKVAKLRAWQTDHYTPEQPTYVVDLDTIESALGPGGAAAMVRAKLAEETPEGFLIHSAVGRVEWLWKTRQKSRAGGDATRRKHRDKTGPVGPPTGQPAGLDENPLQVAVIESATLEFERDCSEDYKIGPTGPPEARPAGPPQAGPQAGPLTLILLPEEDLSLPRAIPPSAEPVPAQGEGAWHRRQRWWRCMVEADTRIKAAGIEPNAPPLPAAAAGTNERNLAACERQLAEAGYSPADVDAKMRHIVLVAEAEALREGHRRWFKPALIWDPDRASRAADTSLAEAAAPREAVPRAGPKGSAERAPSNEPPRRQPKTLTRP